MLDGRLRTNLELMGFTLIGNVIPYFHIYGDFKNYHKEEDDMEIISSEIKELIKNDILEAIENELKEDKHSKPEKWIKELINEGLL